MTDQDGDRAYSDARRAEGSSRADCAVLARGHQDPHDAVEREHYRHSRCPDRPAAKAGARSNSYLVIRLQQDGIIAGSQDRPAF